ncbi:MAG: pilus assembly protein PilM, partial [Fimbriimonadaceae bacterium]|nr:pilus assembly protein PilM [Fimbriimonadaceae bacterium]
MEKKLTSAVGIDLGSNSIKVAEVKLQGRDPVVTALGIAPTPAGAVDHMGVMDTSALVPVIKSLCAQVGVSSSDAIVSIAGQASVLVRT